MHDGKTAGGRKLIISGDGKRAEEAEKSEPLNMNRGVMGSIGHTHLIWRF
jgi:hypothetical protein